MRRRKSIQADVEQNGNVHVNGSEHIEHTKLPINSFPFQSYQNKHKKSSPFTKKLDFLLYR